MFRFKPVYLILVTIALISASGVRAENQRSFTFGIAPQQSSSELGKRWIPILKYLTEKSGVKLQFRTEKDIPTYQKNLNEGRLDIAYINPYHYTIINKRAGYIAFAKEANGRLEGIIVTNKKSAISNAKQLDGKIMAFPSPNALGATWLPIDFLSKQGVSVNPEYVNSLESVYRSVAKGIFVAGGGEMRTLSLVDENVKSDLDIFWTSKPLPPFAFCALPKVPPDAIKQIQKAMVDMSSDKKAIPLLRAINFSGFEIATDQEYDDLRALGIKPVVKKP